MDYISDQNPRSIYFASSTLGLPAYAGSQPLPTAEEVSQLPDSAFADPTRRELPIHTKAAALLSAIYFAGSYSKDPKIEERLVKAADFQGIADDYVKFTAIFSAPKSAAQVVQTAQEDFALEVNMGSTEAPDIQHYYSIKSASAVEDSAKAIFDDFNAGRIPVDWFYEGALALMKKAKLLNVDKTALLPAVVDVGTERLPDFEHAEKQAALRAHAGVPVSGVEMYTDIVKSAAADPSNLRAYVNLWVDLDTMFKVAYSNIVENPFTAFYSGETLEFCEKLAREVVLVQNVPVPKDVLAAMPEVTLLQNFRKDAATKLTEAVKKASEDPAAATAILDTLPKEESLRLLALLTEI